MRQFFGRSAAPQKRVYAAADVNRLTGDWFTSLLSSDQELKGDLRRLRGAARSLERDNPYGARYPGLVAENVVGAKGIQLQMRLKTTRDTPAASQNKRVEEAFRMWGDDPRNASADGRQSWAEIQQMVIRRLPVDGEVLVRHVRGADNEFGYALQLLDPDLLDVEYGGSVPVRLQNGNEIRMGIEVETRFGRPVAYWLWTGHPSDHTVARRRERVPAEDIEHIFISLRPGQSRGVTWFAPVLFASKMRGGFEEAAITAARIGASSMAAITTDPEKSGVVPLKPGASAIPMEMEPARFIRLAPGEAMQELGFDYPSATFGPFIKNIDRSIAQGLNVSYTSLTGDLEAVNYSSIRAGLLSERDYYRGLQQFLIAHLHRRVFREWARMASATGWIAATDVSRLVAAADWKPRGWQWVDPRNDVEAAALGVREGFTTRSDIAAERGLDFEDVIERIAQENALAESLGVTLGTPIPATPAPAPSDSDDDGSEDDDSEDDAPARAAVSGDGHLPLALRRRVS